MENLIGIVGILASITSIIVQVLKNILPKAFPTKILTTVVAIIITIGYIVLGSIGKEITIGIIITSLIGGCFGGFVVAFTSMFGFDTLKETIERYTKIGGEE